MNDVPAWDRAVIDIRKLGEYCLSRAHPRGQHKAKVFEQALGIHAADADWLRGAILKTIPLSHPVALDVDRFGERWRMDLTIVRHGASAVVRTVWIVADDRVPRLLTCWVL